MGASGIARFAPRDASAMKNATHLRGIFV